MVESLLDGIPGLGEIRRKALRQALRLAEEAAGRRGRRDRRGARHRPAHRRWPSGCGGSVPATPDCAVRPSTRPRARSDGGLMDQPATEPPRRDARREHARRVVVVTGLSGAGRSTAAKGSRTSAASSSTTCRPSCSRRWSISAPEPGRDQPIAVVMDVRSRRLLRLACRRNLAQRRRRPRPPRAVPRGHRRRAGPPVRERPAAAPAAGRAAGCIDGIAREREVLAELRATPTW